MDINEHITKLIHRHLTQTCTNEEISELVKWLEESEEHRDFYAEIAAMHSAAQTLTSPDYETRKTKLLNRLNDRIDAENFLVKRKRHFLRVSIGMAAALVLVTGLYFVMRDVSSPDDLSSQMMTYAEPSPETLPDEDSVSIGLESGLDRSSGFTEKVTPPVKTPDLIAEAQVPEETIEVMSPVEVLPRTTTYENPSLTDVLPVTLEDGTTVYLGEQSRLEYYEGTLNPDAQELLRVARLQGQAYFDVARDTSFPFVVKTDELLVKVLGTQFVVESFADSECTNVTLIQGSVALETPEEVHLTDLVPNQKAVFKKGSAEIVLETVEATGFEQKYKRVSYEAVNLNQLIHELEKLYGVELYTEDTIDEAATYDISLSRDRSLEEALAIVRALSGVELKVRQIQQ